MKSPLTWLRERWQASSPLTRIVSTWLEGRDLPTPLDFARLGEEGYRKNVIIFACIRSIATSAAEPTLRVYTGTDPATQQPLMATDDPLLERLQEPNPEQGSYEFLEQLVTHLYVTGNAYIHKVRAQRVNRLARLYPLRPDRIRIVPGAQGVVAGYQVILEGRVADTLPPQDVIHLKFPDVANDYYGLSPLAVAAATADLDSQAVDFLRTIFLNRGIPAGILKLQSRVEASERRRIKEQWVEEYSGFKGWHRLAVLDGGAEYQDIGMKLNELHLDGVLSESEARLCMVLDVPPIIIGAKIGLDRGTYANYASAERSWWLETLAPLYRRLGDVLTRGLGQEYGRPRRVAFDLSTVTALQEEQAPLREFAIKGWESGLLMRNEARQLVQQPPTEGGEVFKASVTQVFVPVVLNGDGQPVSVGQGGRNGGNGNGQGNGQQAIEASWESLRPRPLHLGEGERHAAGVDGAPADADWKTLHRIADSGLPAIQDALTEAVAAVRAAVDEDALTAAIDARDVFTAGQLIPWQAEGLPILQAQLPPELERLFGEAGEASERALRQQLAALTLEQQAIGMALRFDLLNPRAVAWIQSRAGLLIRQISDSQRDSVRAILQRAFEEGIPPRQAAKLIRGTVGLTTRQGQAVLNFRQGLLDQGLSADVVEARTERYTQQLLRYRSETIARTETIAASSAGQQELWLQARDEGFLPEDRTRRHWIVTPDDRLDEIQCAPMPELNADGVGLEEPFRTGDGGTVMHPPVH